VRAALFRSTPSIQQGEGLHTLDVYFMLKVRRSWFCGEYRFRCEESRLMLGKKTALTFGTILTSAVLAFAAAPWQGGSAGKGLDKGGCEKKESCSWVDAYTRKDGIKVSGHCRTKNGQKK
jgi:hypothetical protein